MPQVKSDLEIVDGWYKNVAPGPRTLGLGTITFLGDQVRFVPAKRRLESRYVNDCFLKALANGHLVGPRPENDFDRPAPTVVAETPAVEEKIPVVIAAAPIEEKIQTIDEVIAVPAVEEPRPRRRRHRDEE